MKLFLLITLIFISNSIFANDSDNSDLEVINLHENKSLDQMVLENLNNTIDIEEVEVETEVEVAENSNNNDENETSEVEVTQIEFVNDNLFSENEIKDLNNYFNKLQKIHSTTLQNEVIEVLENIKLNLDIDQDRDTFFFVVNYLKSIGQINKSYELIAKRELSNDKKLNFYTKIKLNYLLSTFQLIEACNYKEELNADIKLDYFFLEKLDIFCLILKDNYSEASLLNSILIESETNLDNYFQNLFSFIFNSSDQENFYTEIKNLEINSELIFLYSAMTRIAELPFSHEFYEIDKKNLSIPIILNQASPIDLRIKAANESFLENLITVDSLAALYMSADFNSAQLNNPKDTIDSFLNNKELCMAFLYQLINIQIFPNDRLNALIQFWDYAKQNNLEEIAYKLSINTLSSIEANSENIIYGTQIASAYIINNDFENSAEWIELYENTKEVDSKSIYTRILLDLYSSDDLNTFINSINLTLSTYNYTQDIDNNELLFVLKSVMNLDISSQNKINLDKIFDNRPMPSILLIDEINKTINNKDDGKFLLYSLISLNDKSWNDIHPEHLMLILKGYLQYKDGTLFRNLVLEVLKSYNFII